METNPTENSDTQKKNSAGMKSAGEKEVGASRGSSLLTVPPIIMEVEYGSLQY